MFILFVLGHQQTRREISKQVQCQSYFGCPAYTASIKIQVFLLENRHLYAVWDSGGSHQWSLRGPDLPLCPGTARQASKSGLVCWMLFFRIRSATGDPGTRRPSELTGSTWALMCRPEDSCIVTPATVWTVWFQGL